MSDLVIKAEGLGKKYLIGHQTDRERYTALRDVLARNVRDYWRKAKALVHGEQIVPGDTQEAIWLSGALAPYVPQFRYALHDISPRSSIEIQGEVLTRLVQLALRHIDSDQPLARLQELLGLIAQVIEQPSALAILESLLRYYVQGTRRLDEQDIRALLQNTSTGEPLMQTFIDRYIEQGLQQGLQQGEATILLRLLERKFGPPSELIRERITQADAETLLEWSDRLLVAHSLDEVLH